MTNLEKLLVAAEHGGVVRTKENSLAIDRQLQAGVLKMRITDEKNPISSKRYFLAKRYQEKRNREE